MLFKAEVYVELEYETLCSRCFFFSGGSGFNECSLMSKAWASDTTDRPEDCPLKEVKVMR